jgi:hypothetical protein
LDQVFRLEQKRTVSNDWVVRYDNRLLQLERQSGRPPARSTVLVYESSDGQLEIRYRDRVMRWTEIAGPLPKPAAPVATRPVGSPQPTTPARRPRQCADHPWHQGVSRHREYEQFAKDRRAWERVQP